MGLNREIRNLNKTILTDKQERQQERQEKKELKELERQEEAQKQNLQLYLKSKINEYLTKNFNKYKSDLYLLKTKDELKQDYINKNREYIDIIFLYFDRFYYKTLKEQIKIHELNQKALLNKRQQFLTTTPNTTPSKNKLSIWQIIFLFFFHFFNILNLCLCGFSKNKRRL